jgi:integrator complex subunit 11
MAIKVVPLGAGQDVGRSCIIVTVGGKNIMLDCGMHMGYNDHRRFPDFRYLSNTQDFDAILDLVLISHFHLDHCGALPYFTEICGYSGPILMTYPTKAIAPLLLEDMRKVCVERKNETNFFTQTDIKNCMNKVTCVDLNESFYVDDQIEVRAYYAGHVLGACMFHVKVRDVLGISESFVYTGDYNMTPDRHLGAAWIDRCKPDLLISESTYATTIRDSKRQRERDFLKKVHECVIAGGKVLVPVFALGRAQELLILIESYWDRMQDLHRIPIYFSAGLTERANDYYKLFISWTNEKVKEEFVQNNMFDFKRIQTWKPEYAEEPGPMVLFASPGMLHAGTSLQVFTKWCHDPLNMVIMPGYCVAGTVGSKVLAGEKHIEIDRFKSVVVNLQVKHLSFSAHADATGILKLITMSGTKSVMLVHGEKQKMAVLKAKIEGELGIPCYDPPNGYTCVVPTNPHVPVLVSEDLIDSWKHLKGNEYRVQGAVIVQHRKGGTQLQLVDVPQKFYESVRSLPVGELDLILKRLQKPLASLGDFSVTKNGFTSDTTEIVIQEDQTIKIKSIDPMTLVKIVGIVSAINAL